MSEKKVDRRSPEEIDRDTENGHEWGECPDCKKEDLIHGDFMCCGKCFMDEYV